MPLIVSMLNTTVFQSIAIGSDGIPSIAILPPWHIASSICRRAAGEPDISRPTSKPSFMSRSAITRVRSPERTSRATVAPIRWARARR